MFKARLRALEGHRTMSAESFMDLRQIQWWQGGLDTCDLPVNQSTPNLTSHEARLKPQHAWFKKPPIFLPFQCKGKENSLRYRDVFTSSTSFCICTPFTLIYNKFRKGLKPSVLRFEPRHILIWLASQLARSLTFRIRALPNWYLYFRMWRGHRVQLPRQGGNLHQRSVDMWQCQRLSRRERWKELSR